MPHPRHDHPPELVGNKDGICPTCATAIEAQRDLSHAWDLCACGAGIEEIEERMKRFATEGLRTDYDVETVRAKEAAERGISVVQDTAERERGRSRSRSRGRGRGMSVGERRG